MSKKLQAITTILDFYHESPEAKYYGLTKDEYMLLYSLSAGCEMLGLVEHYGRSRAYVYKIQKELIKKFAVKTLYQVMFLYGQLDNRKKT